MLKNKINKYLVPILVFGLLVNSHVDVHASPARQQGVEALVAEKIYIVDKNNIGGHGCSDTWPGVLDQPLCTIDKGISLLQPGDILLVRKGSYPSFAISKSGTAGKYITISGYYGEMPLISSGRGIELVGVSYVVVRGFEVTGIVGDWAGGITLRDTSSAVPNYNIIEDNKVHDNTYANMSGIKVSEGSYNKILHNEVYNNYYDGIRVASDSHPVTENEIGYNTVYNNKLAVGDSDGIGLFGTGVTRTYIHDNIVHDNADDGIDTWNSTYNVIIGNISYNHNGAGNGNGFKMGGDNGGHNTVKNNIAYNNKARGFDSNGSGGNTYYNNVAYNNGGYGFQDSGRRDSSCTLENCPGVFINNIGYNNLKGNFSAGLFTLTSHNNIWYSDSGSPQVAYEFEPFASLAAFYAASGNRLDNPNAGNLSSFELNPKFANPSGLQFDLQASSPAIDHGDPANPGQVTATNRVDIGTFEFGCSLVSVTTVMRANTNPSNLSNVDFLVIFSRPVTGVDVTDFDLTLSGVSNATVSGVRGSGSFYTVTVNTGGGSGSIRLDVVDNNSIIDAFLHPLGGTAAGDGNFTDGELYTINNSSIFIDVPLSHWANGFVERMYRDGLTGGCTALPLNFCPANSVTRAQMAVFLVRAMHGTEFVPPAAKGIFSDVPASSFGANFIEQLASDGVTSGCGNGKFCPGQIVTRSQMAVFLVRAMHGNAYVPPKASGIFSDVPAGSFGADHIEQLVRDGITSGCTATTYCPSTTVKRDSMAVMLVRAFNLP